jgi:beta-glucanase (GH16 family)
MGERPTTSGRTRRKNARTARRTVTATVGLGAAAALTATALTWTGSDVTDNSELASTDTSQAALVWSDEFDGAAGDAPDPANWNHETGDHGWGNNELQNYTAARANSALDGNGNLVITARREANGGYTSARMTTKNKVQPQYGHIEARIKIPRGQGIWPAFWMLGGQFPGTPWHFQFPIRFYKHPHLQT